MPSFAGTIMAKTEVVRWLRWWKSRFAEATRTGWIQLSRINWIQSSPIAPSNEQHVYKETDMSLLVSRLQVLQTAIQSLAMSASTQYSLFFRVLGNLEVTLDSCPGTGHLNHSKMPCMHACIDARRMVEKLVTPLTSFHQTFGIMLSQLCTPPNPQAKNPEGSLVPHSARLSFKKEHDQDQNQQNTWYIDHYTMSRTRNMQNTILIDRSKHNESETDQVNWCPLTILDYPLISLRILHESVSLKFLSCKVTHQIQVLDVDPQFQIVDVLRHLRLETSKISKLAWKLLKIC